jgi:hypothetical protein
MVHCEYCQKALPKGTRRKKYFFIYVEEGEPIHPDGLEAHVDENHHEIKVCKKCEKKIFCEKKDDK